MSMKALIHREEASAALRVWLETENESANVKSGIEALVALRAAFQKLADTGEIDKAAERLLSVYRNFGGDLDGEAAQALNEEIGQWGNGYFNADYAAVFS